MNENVGTGKSVPPSRLHVVIYFLEKGATELEALTFYDLYSKKRWLNNRLTIIKNWKVHAWCYIWARK